MTRAPLEEIKQQLARLSRRRGSVVLGLWGDAGSGKTWTVREARRAAAVRSVEVHASWTPGAVAAALPRPARQPAWLPSALARLELDHAEAADTVAALLGALAPFALHVEDLHDADPVARRWWDRLVLRVRCLNGVGLIFTSRAVLGDEVTAQRTVPLSQTETAALLDAELGTALPHAAALWIHDRTQGHPLFALEFLRLLVMQGNLYNDGQRWHWRAPHAARLPSGVEALIAHQLRTTPLTPAAQQVWETLILCPAEIPPDVWRAAGPTAAGMETAAWTAGLDQLRRAGLVHGQETAHPLYREVAQSHGDPAEQRRRASRAVSALAASDPQLAASLVGRAELSRAEARTVLERGAHAALAAGHTRQAATFLTQMLDTVSGAERAALALDAARLWSGLDPVRAGQLAREVLRAEPDHLEAAFLLAGALVAQGDGEGAERLIGPLRERGGPAWFLRRLILHAEQHQYPAVLAVWRAGPQWHADAPPDVLAAVGRALEFCGEPFKALELLTDALRPPPSGVLERCALLMARCRAHYNAGQPAQAEQDATAVVNAAGAGDHLPTLAAALASRATIRDTLGRFEDALDDAGRSLALFAALGLARDHAQQQTRLACLLLEYGEYGRAEALLHEGRQDLLGMGPTHFLALSEMNLAYLYLEQCPPYGGALALHYSALAVRSARRAGSPLITAQALGVAARAEALHGAPARALQLAHEAQALTGPDTHDMAWITWALGFALEAGGDPAGAEARFQDAARQLQARRLDLWAARLGLEADRLTGNRPGALAKLALFRRHALHNWVNVTQRYFPDLAEDRPLPVPATPDLHLGVLGPWQISRRDQRLPFRAPLGRALLTCLLEARIEGRPGVTPLDLQQTLYPHLPDDQAAAALHQLIYRTRQSLGAALIVLTDHGYALGNVQTDAEDFLTGGGAELWRGLYLDGHPGPAGPGPVADRLYARLRALVLNLAARNGPPDTLARTGQLLLCENPFDRELLALVLRAMEETGQTRAAQVLLRDVKRHHAEVGETFPG